MLSAFRARELIRCNAGLAAGPAAESNGSRVDLAAALIVIVAGAAMGWINNVAGGAGIFALWAFEYACGLPLATANPTARVGAIAIGVFSFLGYLRAGRRPDRRAWLSGLAAVPGAWFGAKLALELPPLVFRVYLATLMALLLRQQLRRQDNGAALVPPRQPVLALLGCLLIGLHMGFAQIGTGLVATLLLSAAYQKDLVAVNAAKSTIVILTSITSVGSFAADDAIAWPQGLCLALGAAGGSYAASHWSVKNGSTAVRRVVIAIAIVTLLEQLVRAALLLAGA